jgi:hypothetical protein
MPKEAQDLRVHGISFEDAVKRMTATPPMPSIKAAQKSAKKPKRKK